AAFGAFVDIGVHQDGLVHISAMSKTFIKDPREVVKPGDIVKVKVLEVDVAEKAAGAGRRAGRSDASCRRKEWAGQGGVSGGLVARMSAAISGSAGSGSRECRKRPRISLRSWRATAARVTPTSAGSIGHSP